MTCEWRSLLSVDRYILFVSDIHLKSKQDGCVTRGMHCFLIQSHDMNDIVIFQSTFMEQSRIMDCLSNIIECLAQASHVTLGLAPC